MANASLGDLILSLRAVDQGFKKTLMDAVGAVEHTQKAITDVDERWNRWMKETAKSAAVFAGFGAAVAGAMAVANKAFNEAAEGAKIMSAEAFFKKSGKDIEAYRQSVQGMVSDAKLMKKANLADSMGIDEKTFQTLVKVAQVSAQKTGQSFEYMFDSIIVGTARSSRLLLDNLGIIVSVEQANRNYAKSLGIADDKLNAYIDSMSAEEKQLAFVNEVRKQASGSLLEAAEVGETASVKFEKLTAQVENLSDAWKRMLAAIVSNELSTQDDGLINYFTRTFKAIEENAAGFVTTIKNTLGGAVAGALFGTAVVAVTGGAALPIVGGGVLAGGAAGAYQGTGDTAAQNLYNAQQLKERAKLQSELSATFKQFEEESRRLGMSVGTVDQTIIDLGQMTMSQIDTMEQNGTAYDKLLVKIYDTAAALEYLNKRMPAPGLGGVNGEGPSKQPEKKLKTGRAEKEFPASGFGDLMSAVDEFGAKEVKAWEQIWNQIRPTEAELSRDMGNVRFPMGPNPMGIDVGFYRNHVEVQQKALRKLEEAYANTTNGIGYASDAVRGFTSLIQGDFSGAMSQFSSTAQGILGMLGPQGAVMGAIVGLGEALAQMLYAIADKAGVLSASEERKKAADRQKEYDAAWGVGEVVQNALDMASNAVVAVIDPNGNSYTYMGLTGLTLEEVNFLRKKQEEMSQGAFQDFLFGPDPLNRTMLDEAVAEQRRAREEAQRAQEENTAAIRDLIREFRNLPQSYKVTRAIYDSDRPDFQLGTAIPVAYNIFNEGR